MQKTLNVKNWYATSRCRGCLRYQRIRMGKCVLWVLLGLLAAKALMVALQSYVSHGFTSTGASADVGLTLLITLVCAGIAAGSSTRFLLRFGTPRTSVWMLNIVSLMVWMVLFLLGTLLLETLESTIVWLLHNQSPENFRLISYANPALSSTAVFKNSLYDALKALPEQILWTVEYACLFYLLGCCFRRNKGITLAVVLGVPFMAFVMMLVPALQQSLAAVQSGASNEMMRMGMSWMQWIVKAVDWMETQWPLIQLLAAVASLPLSYICMRSTKQP